MLMREVNHRVKNQYSVILSMIRETNNHSDSPDIFERQVRERIMALSRSHDLLVTADWRGASISDLLLAQAKPFGREDAITMAGPAITLSPMPSSISELPSMNCPQTPPNMGCCPVFRE